MTPRTTTQEKGRASFWGWPGPADLYVLLIVAGAMAFVSALAGHSQVVMACATSLIICVGVAYEAFRAGPSRWTPYAAWVMRTGVVISGCWLLFALPSYPSRLAAVCILAALYIVAERTAWRRAASDNHDQD
jgi:hypothetical protein